jgi:glycosyltransferase involved in cell wall biosynthesis
MQGAHFNLAKKVQPILDREDIDFIWTGSLVDVCALKGLLKDPPRFITFFHEHQLAYPLKRDDQSEAILRDHILPGIHASQIMASDVVLFSSAFNRQSLKEGIERFFSTRPEKSKFKLDEYKTSICPLPFSGEFSRKTPFKERPRRILWNHRWEYDKGPEEFIEIVHSMGSKGVEFELDLLGHARGEVFNSLKGFASECSNFRLSSFGGPSEVDEYRARLGLCRVLPVTSLHDFYGLSVREAILSGVIPLLPNRMVYPECIPRDLHKDLLYESSTELVEKTMRILEDGLTDEKSESLITHCQKHNRQEFEENILDVIGLLNSL